MSFIELKQLVWMRKKKKKTLILRNVMPITFSQYFHKRKNSGFIPHWKMSVRYRGLKPVLCIQKLGHFGYTPLLVSLEPPPFSPCAYVC